MALSKLVEDFFNMKEEILSRDFDLGFSGNSEDVVMRALHLLGNCVNVTSSANRNGEFTIAPSQTVPALFELNFYSNGLFHVFISDAIIGMLSEEVVVVVFAVEVIHFISRTLVFPGLYLYFMICLQPAASCHCSESWWRNQSPINRLMVPAASLSVRRDSSARPPGSLTFLSMRCPWHR